MASKSSNASDSMDNAQRLCRYTNVRGLGVTDCTGTFDLKPKGSGRSVERRVEFLADCQPNITVKTIVATLMKTLWSPEMIAAAEIDLVYVLTDGDIAVDNLESARHRSWSQFWHDSLRPGISIARLLAYDRHYGTFEAMGRAKLPDCRQLVRNQEKPIMESLHHRWGVRCRSSPIGTAPGMNSGFLVARSCNARID